MKTKKERPKLTVKNIREIQPLADIYELNTFRKYIVTIRRPSIISAEQGRSKQIAQEVLRVMIEAGIQCYLIANVDDEIKFLELGK